MMKIGVIGPAKSIEKVDEVIKENFKYIELIKLDYTNYQDALDIIQKYQRELHGLLFTGTTPFIYASANITPSIPWEYIPRHGSSLLTALLEASVLNEYDIRKISFDSYNIDFLNEVYKEIGITKESMHIHVAEEKIYEKDYTEYLYDFHKKNYKTGKVSCCITAIDSVYNKLYIEKIPCFKIKHTSNIIRESIKKLKLKHLVNINQSNQMVVLSVEIDSPDEQSIIHNNEYQMAFESIRVSEQIYLFAQRIQAAVVELNLGNYLLFSTKSILETETENLTQIDLLNMIRKNTKSTVSIGIGYGRTARESKYGANMGKDRAKKCGGNRIFAVYDGEKIIGPINNLKPHIEQDNMIDRKLLEIAQNSGLGKNTIFKLYSIIMQYKIDTITPKELARLYGITLRSMNRIISVLEQKGYIQTVGKKLIGDAGRPSRVIKILLN